TPRTHRLRPADGRRTHVAKLRRREPPRRPEPVATPAPLARRARRPALPRRRRTRRSPWLAYPGLWPDARRLFAAVAPGPHRLRATNHARLPAIRRPLPRAFRDHHLRPARPP